MTRRTSEVEVKQILLIIKSTPLSEPFLKGKVKVNMYLYSASS